jgi:hypothetical protein
MMIKNIWWKTYGCYLQFHIFIQDIKIKHYKKKSLKQMKEHPEKFTEEEIEAETPEQFLPKIDKDHQKIYSDSAVSVKNRKSTSNLPAVYKQRKTDPSLLAETKQEARDEKGIKGCMICEHCHKLVLFLDTQYDFDDFCWSMGHNYKSIACPHCGHGNIIDDTTRKILKWTNWGEN